VRQDVPEEHGTRLKAIVVRQLLSEEPGGTPVQPINVLHLVQKGFVIATSAQVRNMSCCVDLEIIDRSWVPRWAMHADAEFAAAGVGPRQRQMLFALGREAVSSKLEALVKPGERRQAAEERNAWSPEGLDLPTHVALVSALWQHRADCSPCRNWRECELAAALEEEIVLFPRDRRRWPRRS